MLQRPQVPFLAPEALACLAPIADLATLWLPGDFTRLVREGLKRDIQIDMTFCMDDPFTQSQDVLDSIIKTRIYAQTGLLFKPSPLKRLPLHLVQCHQRDRVLF